MIGKIVIVVTLSLLSGLIGAGITLHKPQPPVAVVPQVPDAGVATATPPTDSNTAPAPSEAAPVPAQPAYPVRVVIPVIGLDDLIQTVGLTSSGAMDVPNGTTHNVGWYQGGTVPGVVGSAVLDAHVFAAFARLQDLHVGSDIYVVTSANQTLHFKVEERDLYLLADVPLNKLFNRTDQPRLNLITCAGKLTPDKSTYDHRLVLYAVLVS